MSYAISKMIDDLGVSGELLSKNTADAKGKHPFKRTHSSIEADSGVCHCHHLEKRTPMSQQILNPLIFSPTYTNLQ